MIYKVCTQCGKNKSTEQYYRDYSVTTKISYRQKCKKCCQKLQKKRKANKKTKILCKECKNCKEILPIDKFYKNARYKDGYFSRCKTCHDTKPKTGYIVKRTKEYMKEYNKIKYSSPRYIIRNCIKNSLKQYNKDAKNNDKTSKFLGCTISFFRKWIEYQFYDDMSWKNHGSYWHLDHVKPCASYNLKDEKEVFKCYNWKNYRPLEASENLDKGDAVIPILIDVHKLIVKDFLNEIEN